MVYSQSFFKKTKYNNVRQTYDGYSYMSKLEARQAAELDLMLKGKAIKAWEKQYKVELRAPNGKLLCNYYCDFRIEHNDGTFELLETKGFETDVYKLKRKLLENLWLPEHLDHIYTVVK